MDLNTWLAQWKQKSPEVQSRVDTALQFMQRQFGARPDKILSELKCIDFSKPVSTPALSRGDALVGFKDSRVSPYKGAYFTRSGYPSDRLGIATTGNLRSNPKILDKVQYRYEVLVAIPPGEALQSTCAPAKDSWSVQDTRVLAAGGGLQYLIPHANRYLRYVAI